jgi:nucleotide-binding universal stress UspA family protein
MFARILVPLDGSNLAEQVLPHVARIARGLDSEVAIVGVCEPEESDHKSTCAVSIKSQVERFKRDLGEVAAGRVSEFVLVGRPAEEIIRYAQKNDVGVIVMSCHGRSGIAPWSLGSTVDRVLHRLGVPLLVIRATEPPFDSGKVELFSRILVPLDGSERGEAALPYVRQLMKGLESEAILLQVLAPGKHVHTVGGLDYVRFEDHDLASMRKEAEAHLNRAGAKLAGTGAIVRYEIRIGDPAQEIVKSADETVCCLIAMSTHGHSAIERWVYGSVTYKVLQSFKHAILLVPSSRSTA